MSELPPRIYRELSAVAKDVGAIGKTKRNEQQNYMFRGIDDFLTAAHPALIEHNITITPEVIDRWMDVRDRLKDGKVVGVTVHTVLTMRYTFWAYDGSSISAVVCGEGADTADKATNKAMSAAFKYALMQVLCIPLEDMADGDKTTPDMGATKGGAVAELSREDYAARARDDVVRQADMHRRDALTAAIAKLDGEAKAALRSFCTVEGIPNVVGKMDEDQIALVEGWLVGPPEDVPPTAEQELVEAMSGIPAAEGV